MSTPDSNPTTSKTTPEFSCAAGQKLAGCYVLASRVETGDPSEVWLAQDEVLGKNVCLHFIPQAVRKDARALPELRQEIKRDRQLIHPNILRVYDLIEEPEWAAISTDAFDGESVAVLLAKQPAKHFSAASIEPWVGQLAQTIEEAHKINVLHRDLAPANLFLSPAGKLLVANFGISRVVQDALGRAGGGDMPHAAFASPQSLEGKPPGRTDDVYSIGALLYTLLAGRVPFAGADAGRQAREGVTPAVLAALQNADLAVPAAWQKAIGAALEKNPEARPQTAGEMVRRLGSDQPASSENALPASKPKTDAPKAAAEEPATSGLHKESSSTPARKDPETPKPATTAPAKAPAERPLTSEFSPRMYPERSGSPVRVAAIAAGLIIALVLAYKFSRPDQVGTDEVVNAVTPPPEQGELRVAITPAPPVVKASSKPATPALIESSKLRTPAMAAVATPKSETKPPATPTPPAVALAPATPGKSPVESALPLEQAKQAAQAAEKALADIVKQQKQAEAGVADTQKMIDDKVKALAPVKKSADEALAQRKKLEDDQKTAEAAAAEAQRLAAEKAKLVDDAKKAIIDADKKNQEKIAAQDKANAEIEELKKTLAEKQRLAAEATKAATDAETARQQRLAAVARSEQEIEAQKAAAMAAQRKREADDEERRRVEQELADMKKMFADKMAELEAKRKALENPGASAPEVKPPGQSTPPLEAVSPPVPATTPPPVTALPKAATPEPMKLANIPTTPAPLATPTPAPTRARENSLGQQFAPVGEVEFCVWQTRVQDFEVFAKSVNLRSTSWKGPGFKQGPDHPVVNVSWLEAVAFCKWLTDKERKEGALSAQQFYRLPTDLEWSKGVGLPDESGKTPEARDMGVPDVYPWGTAWPPPPGAGNYTGEETGSDVAIKGYDDGFAWTSPVGSFPPNKAGLYDMGGNVWQWCMDAWNTESKAKVLRGASWYNGALKLSLLSSCRVYAAADSSTDNYGFRIVRASEASKTGKK